PVVGDLMKSDTFKRNESEMVVLITPYLVKPFAQNNAVEASAAPVPLADSSQSADLNAIPRLSMDDLKDNGDAPGKKKLAMAPSAGLSQQPMMEGSPLQPKAAEPEREKSALGRVFESNM